MKKIEKITIKLVMLLIGFSLLFPVRALAAEKDEITEKKQIIFLLDASKSMQGDGQWLEAADSACMIASALPKEYEVALLVYNTEIVYEEDFGNINQKTRHALETVELQGYTTPAVALETAADMFDSAAADKRVVFISDGEISLRDQSETETAIRQFENMVDQIAEQGIKIDMFAIPNDKTENEVSYGTKVTSGEQYTVGENHHCKISVPDVTDRKNRTWRGGFRRRKYDSGSAGYLYAECKDTSRVRRKYRGFSCYRTV